VDNISSQLKLLKYLMQADFGVLVRTRRSLLISIIFPIFLLIVWNNQATLSSFGGALQVLAIVATTGILSLSIFGYALAVARDRDKGVFQRLRITPAASWTIMFSRILVQEISNLLIALVVLIFGSHLYHISLTVEDYILALLVSLLAGAVFLSIGQAIVGLINSADTVNAVARFGYIAFLLFGLIGLSGGFGHTVEIIAKWTPFGTVITVFEGLPHLGTWSGHTSLALLTCFGYIAVLCFIGIKWFKWNTNN